jgi:hypothetical protein
MANFPVSATSRSPDAGALPHAPTPSVVIKPHPIVRAILEMIDFMVVPLSVHARTVSLIASIE